MGSSAVIVCALLWGLTGSNRRPYSCKESALPAELSPRRAVRCCPAALRRGYDDMEGGAGFGPAISWVAARRHAVRPPAYMASRQRIELCPPDLESSSPTRKRLVRSKACTESPERSEHMEHGLHDLVVFGGASGERSHNLYLARVLLSQLSYGPVVSRCGSHPGATRPRVPLPPCDWRDARDSNPRDLPADNRLRYRLRQRPVGIGTAVGSGNSAVRLHRL